MTYQPNVDIEAERPAFEQNALIAHASITRNDLGTYISMVSESRWRGWLARAHIAAEREREMRYAADQHDLCCEQYGVGKSPDDPGDTLFERMNRWKALLKRQAEWKRRYYEVVKNYEDYVNAENEAVTKGIVKLETSLAASAEREREMQLAIDRLRDVLTRIMRGDQAIREAGNVLACTETLNAKWPSNER